MSAEKLQAWMNRTGKTVVDIASALQIAPETVRRFLAGKNVNRSTRAMLENLINESSAPQPKAPQKAATG